MSHYSEDHLVEQPALQFMQRELGWEVLNCYDEWSGGVSSQGREGKREEVVVARLRPVLQRLNPELPVCCGSTTLPRRFSLPHKIVVVEQNLQS